MKYMLDTNTFWRVIELYFRGNTSEILILQNNGKFEFFLPQIVGMEIYSVLGKKMRGKLKVNNVCSRLVDDGQICNKSWHSRAIPKLSKAESLFFRDTIKSILDNKHIDFNINIIPIDTEILETGMMLLERYAPKQDLHSLDATIAACAIGKMKVLENLTVYTADKALSNVLKIENVSVVSTLN
jgi:predicted nucleic acid-binding protein